MRAVRVLCLMFLVMASAKAFAGDLKVFGREFCNPYDAGSCINFHYEKIKDAKNLFGKYKYPNGKKAYDDCAANSSPTDGALAYCSMLFHKAEQTEAQRVAMCDKQMIDKYWQTISGDYAMRLYLDAWNCNGRR